MLLPSLLRKFSEMKGIFQRLGEEAAGEIDWPFRRRIEEYSETKAALMEVVEHGSKGSGDLEGCWLGLDDKAVEEQAEGFEDSCILSLSAE